MGKNIMVFSIDYSKVCYNYHPNWMFTIQIDPGSIYVPHIRE